MKLPGYTYSSQARLDEFDFWITPSMQDIDDTNTFREEVIKIERALRTIESATNNFADLNNCRPSNLAHGLINLCNETMSTDEIQTFFEDIFSLLFLTTGKSDNNIKCQFPVYLRNQLKWAHWYKNKNAGERQTLVKEEIPRVLKSDTIAKKIANLKDFSERQQEILTAYLSIILSKQSYIEQLFYTGRSYYELQRENHGHNLINALVTFKIKGSVTSSGGHIPENMLRNMMEEWGMKIDADFNSKDILIKDLIDEEGLSSEEVKITKTRAYDFVLPYKSRGRNNADRLLIQCQFYAGDAGSVSHKNIDQTESARNVTLRKYPNAHFLEFVDGAGYFSSLNGDLKHLLNFPTTKGFFQLRTAPIKLRRELQEIQFLTLLEIEHAILLKGNHLDGVYEHLSRDYAHSEISTAIDLALEHRMLERDNEYLIIAGERREIARRYLLLDGVAVYGSPLEMDQVRGNILIPGYGNNYGIKQNILIKQLCADTVSLQEEWDRSSQVLDDIQWLLDKGYWTIG
ncbi:MAG: hypothetical protein PHW64_04870 [Sulfuricurvum sp.]|nr:hypothetical protein [Sulfuricurvum sp.]